MLCYLPENSDSTEISVTAEGLNDGNAMTKSEQTVSADGDNVITMLTTKDTLLAVTAEVYGNSAIIHAETNKKEWFDIVGIELTKGENTLGVNFELGDGQYQLFSITQEPGQIMLVDPIVMFQDGCCASAEINILTKEYV